MLKRVSPEVVIAETDICTLNDGDLQTIGEMAKESPKGRARICTHQTSDDLIHEMFISLDKGNYIAPHMHIGKSESFHMIEGRLTVIIFSEDGKPVERIDLAAPSDRQWDDQPFYYRLSSRKFHIPIPMSDVCVFHETTNGPFRKEETIYADWAPGEDEEKTVQQAYVSNLLSL